MSPITTATTSPTDDARPASASRAGTDAPTLYAPTDLPAGPAPDVSATGPIPTVRSPLSVTLAGARSRRRLPLPTVTIAGVDLHVLGEQQTIEHILAELDAGRGGVVITPNLDHIYRCTKDLTFSALVAEADVVVADGMPLVWAASLQGTPLPERVAGSNLISSLSGAAALAGRRVFFLGGAPGTAEGSARVLKERFPDLIVAGWHCPPVGFEHDDTQMALIVDKLREAQPDIVFVALGSPKQELLVDRIRRTFPRTWWLGVGVSFSFLTGHVKRAPQWVQRLGLEWLHRLLQEPKRLFHRYVMVGIPFALRLLGRASRERVMRTFGRTAEPPSRRYDRLNLVGIDPSALANSRTHEAATQKALNLPPEVRTDSFSAAPPVAESPMEINVGSASQCDDEARPTLSRLRALVLLGGRLRSDAFTDGIGRPVVELPLEQNCRVMDGWLRQSDEVARMAGLDYLPIRVLVSSDQQSPLPPGRYDGFERPAGAFTVERDASEYRGTAGVLHDLVRGYDDDDLLLVANAGQILLDPLGAIVRTLASRQADVALVGHADGTPGGLTLLSCRTLRGINPVGYVDFKEQALPKIAKQFGVRVVQCRRPTGLPLRSLSNYIASLQRHHDLLQGSGRGAAADPLAEDFRKHFAIVEEGAHVDPSAYLHDSVVLAGARVEAGAAVVRSVVCPGSVVRRDARVVDSLCTPTDTRGRRAIA